MTLHPRDFVLVWTNAIQIGAVRSREQIARLKEVNVRVDVTRQNELAGTINLFPERRRVLLAYRDTFDFVGKTLPSAGLITVPPTSEIFSARSVALKNVNASTSAILNFIREIPRLRSE
jgi:hypothetical protein